MTAPIWLVSGPLAVRFDWNEDRWRHVVCLARRDQAAAAGAGPADGPWQDLAVSIEGGADATWPPSPPVQQLHVDRGNSQAAVLLGMGMAGRSHWSLCVSAPRAGELRFEAACRLQQPASHLGQGYRGIGPVSVDVLDSQSGACRLASGKNAVRWSASPGSAGKMQAGAAGAVLLVVDPVAPPATVCWQYAWRALGPEQVAR